MFEESPDRFFYNQHFNLVQRSRVEISQVLNVPVHECVFVINATTGAAYKAIVYLEIKLTNLRDQHRAAQSEVQRWRLYHLLRTHLWRVREDLGLDRGDEPSAMSQKDSVGTSLYSF